MDLKASCTFYSTEYRIWEKQGQWAFRDLLTLLIILKWRNQSPERRGALPRAAVLMSRPALLSWSPVGSTGNPQGYGHDWSPSRDPTASSCLAKLKKTSLHWCQNVLPGNYGLNSHELWHIQKRLQKSSDSMTQEKPLPPPPCTSKELAGVHF